MANKQTPHYNVEGIGVLEEVPGLGITRSVGGNPPADNATGYAQGCTHQRVSGSITVSTALYVNIGDKDAANFDPLTG